MRRREFIAGLGSAAVWPLAARAQQPDRMRRIGVLLSVAADDPESQVRLAAFLQGLQELGWTVGRNVQIDYRWATGDANRMRYAAELVALGPDVILASSGVVVGALQQTTRTVPIVFVTAIDPVGAGLVASLARPGGNATGFAAYEFSLAAKWLQLLKEIAPGVTRVGVMRDATGNAGIGQWAVIQAFAEQLGVECTPLAIHDAKEIERGIAAFERGGSGGLIVSLAALATVHGQTIIANAAKHRLPAVYPFRYFVTAGGLISYGPYLTNQYRRAAGYVDRILKGEKPADLPVQKPTRYELVLNLKTKKALGLEVPLTLLTRLDEVIG
jgi:putative tryptophan/tyrosine transport system substrate-binding protein